MSIPPYSRLASRLLARSAAEAPPPSAAARADAIAALEAALIRKGRRRLWSRAGFALAAAAALALASLAALNTSSRPQRAAGPAVFARAPRGGAHILGVGPLGSADRPLSAGARVVSQPEGEALLRFATGTEVTLESKSELAIVQAEGSQTLALAQGALRARVAKVAAGRHFIVTTPDAQVEVHGTSFRVSMVAPEARCSDGTRTRVEVYEGVVSVRSLGSEQRVAAGEHWPAACTPPHVEHPPEPAQPSVATPAPPSAATQQPSANPPRPREHKATESNLAAQNDMFARALAAHRAGDPANAVRELELFVERFPDSPLAQDAARERMKWLDTFDHARAAEAARSYLARYPAGYARAEAEAILGSGP